MKEYFLICVGLCIASYVTQIMILILGLAMGDIRKKKIFLYCVIPLGFILYLVDIYKQLED